MVSLVKALNVEYSKLARTIYKLAQMKLIEFALPLKNANAHLLVSFLLHDRLTEGREMSDRKRDRDLVEERYL